MKQTFCEFCREYVDYEIKDETIETELGGIPISYKGKVAYCKKCHSEIYTHYTNDYNLEVLYDAYHKIKGKKSKDTLLA